MSIDARRWFVQYSGLSTLKGSNNGKPVRLLCFPHSGAGASIFHPWRAALPPSIELWAVILPGRERRIAEPPYTHINPLLDALIPAIRALFPLDEPYAIFGHSLGAAIGFEVARRLHRQYGSLPAHLFVSGRPAPQLQTPRSILHTLPDIEFIRTLHSRYGGIPDEVLQSTELLQLVLPILRADIQMSETYQYEPGAPLSCPLTALTGSEDLTVDAEEAAAWNVHTSGQFAMKTLPGGHFYIQSERERILSIIEAALLRS